MEGPIRLRSHFKGLCIQLKPGKTDWVQDSGGMVKSFTPPIYIAFERGECTVTNKVWEKLGVSRGDLVNRLREKAKYDNSFVLMEDIPSATAATSPRSK